MKLSLDDYRLWYTLLGFSFVVRLALAPFTGDPFDMGIWMSTGSYIGFGKSPYDLHPHIGYPPLWAFWCWFSYLLSNSIWPGNEFVYIFLIKLPILCADYFLIAILLQQSKQHNVPSGRMLSALYLLNPYVLIVGVVWGMMDNLVGVFVVSSLLLTNNRPSWSAVLLALGIALKIYPILFLPVVLAFLVRSKVFPRLIKWVTAFISTSIASVWFPFLIFNWDFGGLVGVGLAQTAREPASIAPAAFWSRLSDVGITSLGPISIESIQSQQFLRLAWIMAVIICLVMFLKLRLEWTDSILVGECLLVYLAYLITAPSVSEQLFEPVLILMLLLATFSSIKFNYAAYAFGSAIVLTFLSFHAPLSSLVFPIVEIDGAPLTELGKPFLPWLIVGFTIWLIVAFFGTWKTFLRENRCRLQS